MDEPPLPELYEATLDLDDVATLFGELDRAADVMEVLVRETHGAPGPPRAVHLAAALALARDGKTDRIRVRYRFEDDEWMDTFVMGTDAIRLVRIRHRPERSTGHEHGRDDHPAADRGPDEQ